MKESLTLIKEYYQKAWKHIENNNLAAACKEIYEMPVNLYELSLNIWESTGKLQSTDKEYCKLYTETKNLIGKVDNKLSEISTEGQDYLEQDNDLDLDNTDLQNDIFQNQF